jgi:hypothetical protein
MKLELRREFLESISKVFCAIISNMLSTTTADILLNYYYSYSISCLGNMQYEMLLQF